MMIILMNGDDDESPRRIDKVRLIILLKKANA